MKRVLIGIAVSTVLVVLYIFSAPRITTLPVYTPTITSIGASHEERPIQSYTFGDSGPHVLLVGGMHGGYEANTVQLAYELITYLMHDVNVPRDVSISVIPVLNPDGLYQVVGTAGPFHTIPEDEALRKKGRMNARDIDLNRNFDCAWQPQSMWGTTTVSAGTEPFSEPETQALRIFIDEHEPDAVIFFHSKAEGVYGSFCGEDMHEDTIPLVHVYAEASGYPPYEIFDAYPITGDAEGYLASIGIPAITVELSTHTDTEWERNKKGVAAVLTYFSDK